ncbi:MAG: hypothetical protein ACT4PP_11245, partial [Sporichthyaceae bacterium]
ALAASALEFALEGLYLGRMIAMDSGGGRAVSRSLPPKPLATADYVAAIATTSSDATGMYDALPLPRLRRRARSARRAL